LRVWQSTIFRRADPNVFLQHDWHAPLHAGGVRVPYEHDVRLLRDFPLRYVWPPPDGVLMPFQNDGQRVCDVRRALLT
jgi:hypothetical protein